MEKPAKNEYPIHELIKRRWSPRSFSQEPIDDDVLLSLFEAARWAPSSYNDQPWHFIVGRTERDEETYQDLLECLVEGNRTWARNAPVLGLSVARKNFEFNGEPNRHALHDVGLAMENLVIQAMEYDLFVHQMAGFDSERARRKFSIPKDHDPVAAFAVGYPGDPEQLPDELTEKERSNRERKRLSEFVHSGQWDDTSQFVGDS